AECRPALRRSFAALMRKDVDERVLLQRRIMKSVGYWVPQDAPLKENTLIYVLSHESREAAAKSWAAFRADPDWVKAKAESEKDGPLTTKVESVFADPTDFSPLK